MANRPSAAAVGLGDGAGVGARVGDGGGLDVGLAVGMGVATGEGDGRGLAVGDGEGLGVAVGGGVAVIDGVAVHVPATVGEGVPASDGVAWAPRGGAGAVDGGVGLLRGVGLGGSMAGWHAASTAMPRRPMARKRFRLAALGAAIMRWR